MWDSQTLTVLTCTLQGLAILLTIFRLSYRWRIQQLWWEDAWAVLVLFFGIANLISFLLIAYGSHNIDIVILCPWLFDYSFFSIIWAVRMSMVMSTVRIMPPSPNRRRIVIAMAIIVNIIYSTQIILQVYIQVSCICGCGLNWSKYNTECQAVESLVILTACGNCVADFILLAASLGLLWDVNLPRKQRRMILILFSSIILITIFSLFNVAAQLARTSRLLRFTFTFEIFVSLAVCNLNVMAAFAYRTLRRKRPRQMTTDGGGDTESGNNISTEDDTDGRLALTTIHLDALAASHGTEYTSTSSAAKVHPDPGMI